MKTSKAYHLIEMIEQSLVQERHDSKVPIIDKTKDNVYRHTVNNTRAHFKQKKRADHIQDNFFVNTETSILKSQHINPSTELERMRELYEKGSGLIGIDSILNSS